jgi:outer membrane receptor for ferrienterochelin and colicins
MKTLAKNFVFADARTRRVAGRNLILALSACVPSLLAHADGLTTTNDTDAGAITKSLAALSLEQLLNTEFETVYGASKHEQKTSEAPAAVTIVTADDIRQFGYRTLGDALRSVRGFYVSDDRSYQHIGVRGVNRPGDYGGRILINIDGHRMNDPLYDSASAGLDLPLDVDLIERIEIIRGPASSLYGDNAFFAIINLITRRGQNVNGTELSAAASSYNTFNWRATYGKQFTNGISLMLSGTWHDSDGHDHLYFSEFDSLNNGIADHLDNERVRQGFAAISYGDFSLEGLYGWRKKDAPTASYGSIFNSRPNFDSDERAFVEFKYAHEFNSGWNVHSRVYFDHYYYEGLGDYAMDDETPPGTRYLHDEAMAEYWGGEIQLDKTFFTTHHLTIGGEFHDDLKVWQKEEYLQPSELITDVPSDNDSFGCYLQDEYSLIKNLTLTAGVRYDYYRSFGSTVNPRAGLVWHPAESTTFKLLYGEAYRAPNAYERDYNIDGFIPNRQINPETIRAYELIWEQRLSKPLQFTASLFRDDVHDLITLDALSADTVQFRNSDQVTTQGAEMELAGRWANGWRARVSYTFAVAEDASLHRTLSNAPRHLAKASLLVPLYSDKVSAGLELQGMSARQTLQGSQVPAFAVVNLTLYSRELIKNLEVSAGVYNLLDRHYTDPVGPEYTMESIVQDGRSVRVKLTYRF